MNGNNWTPGWLQKELDLIAIKEKIGRSLRDLSLKSVMENRSLLMKSTFGANLMKNLPTVLKSDLLKMSSALSIDSFEHIADVESQLKELCGFLACLMHSRVKAIHLPDMNVIWTSGNESKFQALVEAIGAECSRLTTLDLRNSLNYESPALTEGSSMGRTFFAALPQLASLRIAQLDNFSCDDWALQQFGLHGHNLVVLQICLHHDVSRVGFKALASLCHLRQLLFGETMREWRQEQKCLMLCSKFLPHLKVAGRRLDVINFDANFDFHRNLGFCMNSHRYHHQIVRQRQPNKLSLENLVLSWHVQPHENCQLPELQSLNLWKPRGNVLRLFDRFSTVTELGLNETRFSPDMVMTVLQSVGQRLRTLVLYESPQALSLVQVFSLCPNLERWRFEFCNFIDVSNEWPEGCMDCLKEAVFGYQYRQAPPGFIVQLLSAPLLKRVEILDGYLTKNEAVQLLDLVSQRLIMHKVVSIKWCTGLMWTDLQPWMADEAQFNLLLNTIRAAFPKIEIVRDVESDFW